jgi:hypothetical protein
MRKFLLKDPLQRTVSAIFLIKGERIKPFKPIASTNHTRSQYRGIHTGRIGKLTCRGTNVMLVLVLNEETYTVTSFDVSNWRLLFTPAMVMGV